MPEAMITPTEIIQVRTRSVACDGGDGIYGHPRVYLRIPASGGVQQIACPYCSRLFVLSVDAPPEAH